MSTIADYVAEAVMPYVSRQLISDETLSRIQRFSHLLPGPLTDFFGFECTMPVEEPKTDFLVCCRNLKTAWEYLAGNAADWDFPIELQRDPLWRRIRSFARVWTAPWSPLFRAVHNVWLEFDIEEAYDGTPLPNVFLGSHTLRSSGPQVDLHRIPEQCAWLTDAAMPLLLDRNIDRSLRLQIARCLSLLPEDANVFQVGLMLARTSDAVRLCVRGLSGQPIVQYLTAVESDAIGYELVQLLSALATRVARIDLDFDITDHVLASIGLECYPKAAQVSNFLTYLVELGLCTSAKAEGIKQWQGQVGNRSAAYSRLGDLRVGPESLVCHGFVRSLHHVKLVFSRGRVVNSKAYLGVHHEKNAATGCHIRDGGC